MTMTAIINLFNREIAELELERKKADKKLEEEAIILEAEGRRLAAEFEQLEADRRQL
ncbi:MAG: hypothetical protein GDA44_05220 [Prochloron sp. SP5CPC1]|nr:hypothetical protein [Candidatus Paraprochloron terpiosi SP5CPC1]